MLKMQISYEDFDNNTQQEDLYFNLNKREMIDLSDKLKGFEELAHKVTKGKDPSSMSPEELGKALIDQGADSVQKVAQMIDTMIDMAYGKRSEDGKRFIKNPEVVAEFKESLAYSAFVDKLLTDTNYTTIFTQGLLPKEQAAAANASLSAL